ncbi:Cobalt-precorrin-5B C(1)-methyltransferase [Hyella patelloides LEGE 07179]|uniref:Cobalt-precorrin-5B C(1)-methyltransferase n=1 Tax=Hyella patelloides LEGE 07179 TaxID=945734 RepID=A0A563VKC6_9CYAN|nr:cobalt-precorrin-5B (C(1))-methyltransferase CbiD [Hyella patelloides]VEP11920.1 Cobalt-precorrin-5B C(1)-methyltransferase [Hyella patelloides LEGE 07179]
MGYTLPVFACASAIAAFLHLQKVKTKEFVTVDLIKPPQKVDISIEQVARLNSQTALAITRSDPGEHLDITRNTPVWALVSIEQSLIDSPQIEIEGGEGIGIQTQNNNQAAIYSYAKELIIHNLQSLLKKSEKIVIRIILPEGRKLGLKTSNSAFGVVEGLSLLGTTGIVQPLTAPSQLEAYQTELVAKAKKHDFLIFCIGENGLDLATKWGIDPDKLVKTANWLGSMLVTAAAHQVKSIILLGYHGKLIKLAGGIWHTHHHLADGRLEILTSYCARYGLETTKIEQIADSATTESALQLLRQWDGEDNSNRVKSIYKAIAESIDRRSQAYISKHTEQTTQVGSILFDRQRKIIQKSLYAEKEFTKLC